MIDNKSKSMNDLLLNYVDKEIKWIALLVTMETEPLIFKDADDLWLPTKLSKQLEFLNTNKHVAVVGTRFCMFGQLNGFPNTYESLCSVR